jgi:putative membrane protein
LLSVSLQSYSPSSVCYDYTCFPHSYLVPFTSNTCLLYILLYPGVVIGFVISYRAMSGYDRYWMGRIAWSDIVKNSRTLSRLIWFHVPLRIKPVTANAPLDLDADEVAKQVMAEKRQALNLIEACVLSV